MTDSTEEAEPVPMPDGTVRRGSGLVRSEAAWIAGAEAAWLRIGRDPEAGDEALDRPPPAPIRLAESAPFMLVAHETLLLVPIFPGALSGSWTDGVTVTLRVEGRSPPAQLEVIGAAELLTQAHHTARFRGADAVLTISVREVVHRAVDASTLSRPDRSTATVDERSGRPGEVVGRVRRVQVSLPQPLTDGSRTVPSGIVKASVEGPVPLRWLNLGGDGQADLWGHGGAFRAVYVYSHDNYAHWSARLGRELAPGTFGENLTVDGLTDDDVAVGDVLRIGTALAEITQPRIPCFKLAMKLGVPGFQNEFLEEGRMGFYLRVLRQGELKAGDAIERLRRGPLSVRRVHELLHFATDDLEGSAEALAIPALSHGWKGSFEERLDAAAETRRRTSFRPFRVTRKVPESATITSFHLEPEDGEPLVPFTPGQFLTLRLELAGEPLLRTYSLSSGPGEGHYRVSIKREEGRNGHPAGLASSHLHADIDEGATLTVGPPRGKFVLDKGSARPVVLLSAGVGLTPLVSMLHDLAKTQPERPVWFIHGARNGAEHALGDEVRRIAETHPNARVHIRYSRPRREDVLGQSHDSEGHIDVDLLRALLPFDGYDFYLVGPPAFMRDLHDGLTELGVSRDRIRYEHFGPSTVLGPARGESAGRDKSVYEEMADEVAFSRSGITTAWDPACETLLDLAEHVGLHPPFSCRSGICQTCSCRVAEGEVEYLEPPLATPADGQALLCVSRPKGKVVLDL